MRRRALAVLTALSVLATAAPARADNAGVTAAPVLQVPLGARAMGMGGAFTAVATDASALQYNPAGLARLNAHEFDFSYIGSAGATTLQDLAYAGPTPLTGVSGNGYTTVAASALFSQSGTIQVNTLNADGTLGSSQNISAGSDMVFTGGYAERVGMTPIEARDGTYNIDHFFGVGGKYLKSTLAQTYHASTFAADVGYMAHSPEAGWSAGISGLNLGGKLRYLQQADPLPATVRGGVAWQGGVPSVHNVITALDGEYVIDEHLWHIDAGVEYFWLKSYGLRMGYRFNYGDQSGLTIGLGYRWKGRVLIDYAYDLGDLLGNGQRVTVAYRFGGVPPSVRARQRRPFIETAPEHEEMPDLQNRQPVPDDTPRPRAVPRERPQGAPGWIY